MIRPAELLAWMLAILAVVLLVAAAVVGVSAGHPVDDVAGVGLVFSIGLPVLGAVVIRQREGGAIGWLMIGMGLSIALATLGDRWARAALVDDPGSLFGGELASWLQAWAWMPGWVLATTLLPVLLPDGRPVGRHRLLAWVDGLAVAAVVTAIAAASWHVRGTVLISEAVNDPRVSTLNQISGVGFVIVGVLTLVSMASLVIRYRGATPGVRRQIAWVVYGAAVAVAAAVIGTFADLGGLVQTLEASALVGGLAVAMFRYRLYDIDAVVNRTLVYGALTAILAGTYLGSVLVLQLALSPSSDLAIAASTLAVAALFRPARTRVQAAVDRRFYRSRYDAQRTLEGFGARLRSEVELESLSAELLSVVADTMQPTQVSLWVRRTSP
jgi:hypothetical protein